MLIRILQRRFFILRSLVRRLVFFVALFTCAIAQAKIDLPEPMASVDRQTKYLLYLQSEIPALFEQGAEYDVDFFNLIKMQDQLVSVLNMDQEWIRMADTRPSLMDLEISIPQNVKSVAREFQYELLMEEIEKYNIRVGANEFEQSVHHLVENQGSSHLVSGLMSLLNSEQKREGHKKTTLSEKIEFLRSASVSSEIFRSKFKPERAGLTDRPDSWSQAVEWADEKYQSELTVAVSMLSLCRQHFNFSDCSEMFGSNDHVWESLILLHKLTNEGEAALKQLRAHLKELFSSKISATSQTSLPVVRLNEVPPYIGVFRGLVGADCSTSLSFPFVYMPGERTYFIYAPDGRLLGYLMGTMVFSESSRRPSLYVHTISGPYLSRRHVEGALYGLQKSARDLGFSEVLIPDAEIAHRNINYVAIHGFLNSLRSGQSVSITYQDGQMRQRFAAHPVISSYFNLQFDGPGANTKAVSLKKASGEIANLIVELSPAKNAPIHFERQLQIQEALLIALDLLAAENSTAAQSELRNIVADIRANHMAVGSIDYTSRRHAAIQILTPFNIRLSPTGRLAISDYLANNGLQNLKDFYERLSQVFAGFSISLDAQMIEKRRSYLFLEGHLKAPDATLTNDPQMQKRTILFVIQMLKRWANPYLAYNVIKNNPAFFLESKKFVNFVEGLFDGTEPEYRILIGLQESGYDYSQMDIQNLKRKAATRLAEDKIPAKDDPVRRMTEILNKISSESCESALKPMIR